MPEQKEYRSNKYQNLAWIASHWGYYLRLNAHVMQQGVPLSELLELKYPLRLPDAHKPPLLSIDFTDACDLQCVYCNNPLFPHPRTMMSEETFACLLTSLREAKINRVRIGGGEPMLHPNCAGMLRQLSPLTRYLSIITNGQWQDIHHIDEILVSGVHLIEISIDAGGAKVYEASRKNANYLRLIRNLRHMRSLRDKLKSKALIKVRLMLRPSTKHLEWQETQFWKRYADCVLPQMLLKHPESDYAEDVFYTTQNDAQTAPVCTIPFKDLQVRPDGRVPLCPALGCSIDPEKQRFLGHVCTDTLLSMWNSEELRSMRQAHRTRGGKILDLCKGCNYS